MTDVVEIAKEHRERLTAEIAKLDDFIRTAEWLIEFGQSIDNPVPDTADEKDFGKSRPAIDAPIFTRGARGAATAKEEDQPVRELKPEEQVPNPLPRSKTPSDRWSHGRRAPT